VSWFDWIPLVSETIDSIRARLNADANAGVSPSDPDYIDTTEGGYFWDATQAPALEIERLWDFLATEVVAAMFVTFAWGDYLDAHGEVLGVPRKDPVNATGTVTFTGTSGTIVGTGTQVAAPAASEDTDPITFETTAFGTVTSGTLTLPVQAIESGTGGNVAAGQVTLPLTDLPGITGITNDAAITGGADEESDEAYRTRLLLEYSAARPTGTRADYERWSLAYPGVGFVTVEPETALDGSPSPGAVRVTITDTEHDPVSDAILNGLQDQLDPPRHVASTAGSHVLPTGTITVDSTAGFSPTGTLRWHDQTITYTGKTSTTFTGATGGTGTIPAGSRVAAGFDQAEGLAPIGANVAVLTPAAIGINVVATISALEGYSATGTGGTISLQAQVDAAISDYIDKLNPGDDVVLGRVESAIFSVTGVFDVTALTLNAVAANVAITGRQVAQFNSPSTLT
jgi:uncharacterized phage protein gp47/JayE